MLGFTLNPQKRFAELGEREILALAISLEEEDARIFREFAEGLRPNFRRRPRCSTAWPRRKMRTGGR